MCTGGAFRHAVNTLEISEISREISRRDLEEGGPYQRLSPEQQACLAKGRGLGSQAYIIAFEICLARSCRGVHLSCKRAQWVTVLAHRAPLRWFCEWVTKRPAHPLCERSHYGPIPRPVESPAWERRGRRTVAFSPLSRYPRALPEFSPRGSGLPALVPGRRPGADPGPTGCAGVRPLRSPATFLTCLRSPR